MRHDESTEIQPGSLLPSAKRQHPELRWNEGKASRCVTLSARAVLGSSVEVDVVVTDPAVSRIHAELDIRDDGLWVRDLHSRNGTSVQGVRVGSARLEDGSRFTVGSTSIAVSYQPKPEPMELWPTDRFGDKLIGRSVAMRELFARVGRAGASDSSVLIQGETGTGKEMIARAIHETSERREKPFEILDCASIPETLLEAELFGHVRGAFTGAVSDRVGVFEMAQGGSVFLDEIGELPLTMQAKLLRVVETRVLRRLGDSQTREVDVRFISATHRDLRRMVNEGSFREDLYFRLAVVPIAVPRLRDHAQDIPLLIEQFLPPGSKSPFGEADLQELCSRPWLGNVRELRNFVEHALVFGAEEALAGAASGGIGPGVGDLPVVPLDRPLKEIRQRWIDHLEREYIRGLLARHKHNVSAVAQAAGLDRSYVHRIIKKHAL